MKTFASDIMSTELQVLNEKSTLEEALKVLVNTRITGVPVVDDQGKMVGVFSDYDVIHHLSSAKRASKEAFREKIRFTKKVEAVKMKTPLSKIMRLFVQSRFRRLPVVNRHGKLVGIITRRDLLKLFYYRATLS